MSGKTGCSQLLAERVLRDVPSALVARISANRMLSNETLGAYFQRKFAMSLEHFVMVLETPRILIVDEAQLLYNTLEGENERFWRVYVKNAMEGALPGLRIVVLAAYGSFDPLRKNPRNSTPVTVPESRIVGLVPRFSDGVTVPGLLLSRHEFDALVGQYSFLTTSKFCDIIWNKTEGHLGVITGLLRFLASRISNVPVADRNRRIQEHLYSNEAYDYLTSNCRGLPQLNDAFKLAASETNTKEAANALANRMINILDSVCRGMLVTRYSMYLSPGSNVASEILQASGFLHYDNQALSFASPLHQAIYMHSTRTSFVTDVDSMTFDRLLEMTIMRLSTFNLQAAADSNADAHGTTPYVRERQLHFEVHRALTTILPPPTFISNEQIVVSTNAQGDKRVGYVDIRININGGWFFELLVNGNAGMEHAARFEQGGKYSTALNQSSKWALIDFRSTKERVLWANYYVHFDDSFTKATLRDVKQGRIAEIDLSK